MEKKMDEKNKMPGNKKKAGGNGSLAVEKKVGMPVLVYQKAAKGKGKLEKEKHMQKDSSFLSLCQSGFHRLKDSVKELDHLAALVCSHMGNVLKAK